MTRDKRRLRFRFIASVLLLSFLIFTPALFSADLPPSNSEIGTLIEAFRRPQKAKVPEEKRKPEIESRLPEELRGAEAEKEFFVKEIDVSGGTALSNQEIRSLVTPFENRMHTLKSLQEVGRLVTQHYRAKGYVTSRAYLPPQEISGGQVRFKILEGKLGKVQVEKNRFFRKKMILREISTKPGEILNFEKLERDLIHLNDHRDRGVKGALLPGEIPETTDLILQVKDSFPLHAGYHFDNLGSRFTGRLRHGVSFTDTNLLSLDDLVAAQFQMTERNEFVGVNVDYLVPLNGTKTQAEFGYTYANTKLGGDFKDLKVHGQANIFTTTLLQRVFENRFLEVGFFGGFDFKESKTSVLGRDQSNDHLRVLRLGNQLAEKDFLGRSFLTNEFNFGFSSFLGASDKVDRNASRAGGGGQFFRYNLGISRLQRLWFSSFMILQGTAQLTPNKLVSMERYRLGGAETVRGYPEGDSIGDYGYNGRAEVRVPFYFIPASWKVPQSEDHLRDAFHGVGFYDLGQAFVKGASETERKRKLLMGVGGGIRVNLARKIVARVDWGYPIGDGPTEKKRARLHFGLTAEI